MQNSLFSGLVTDSKLGLGLAFDWTVVKQIRGSKPFYTATCLEWTSSTLKCFATFSYSLLIFLGLAPLLLPLTLFRKSILRACLHHVTLWLGGKSFSYREAHYIFDFWPEIFLPRYFSCMAFCKVQARVHADFSQLFYELNKYTTNRCPIRRWYWI